MSFTKYETDFRKYVVGLDTKIPLCDDRFVTAINFDNAATTPPFFSVLKEITDFSPWYSSIHRGTGYKSKFSSQLYEDCRTMVLDFVGGTPSIDTVVFTKNTTEAINALAYRLCFKNKKSVVLSSYMEHHSNDLPWRDKYIVDYISVNSDGKLSLDHLERLLKKYKEKVKLVTISAASNVTGYINPIHEIAEIVHKYNAKILVDGAQFIPHCPFAMLPHDSLRHIDYVAFSAHKMYAPFGIGVLVAPKSTFEKGVPHLTGGGTVQIVTHNFVSFENPPHSEEAGTPNIMGAVALNAAIKTLSMLNMNIIQQYEESLAQYTLEALKKIPQIQLYGNALDCTDRLGIIPFNIEGIPHGITAQILSDEGGISVRNGCFCAQPYIQKLLEIPPCEIKKYSKNPNLARPGMVRISFGLYNTYEEIDILIELLMKITQSKNNYIKKYNSILPS